MYDLTKEKDKEFLKVAYTFLQEKVIRLELEVSELRKMKKLDQEICHKLSDELFILRERFFANKQEKLKNKDKIEKKKSKKSKKKLVHDKNPLPENEDKKGAIQLDEEEIKYNIQDLKCPCEEENCKLREMINCFEEAAEINVTERKYTVKKHQRQKYTGTLCGKIITAPGPTKLVKGGDFSIQMGVEVACDKFENHMPLERQKKEMKNNGLEVDTKTLYGLTEHVYNHIKEIPGMIKKEISFQECVCLDESPMTFFNPKKSNGYVWSMSNNFGVFYQFEPTRSNLVAKELLKGFEGAVITDAYCGYDFLNKMACIIHAFCWAHLRRKFFESMGNYPRARKMVELIDNLFDIEHEALDFEHLKKLRAERSFPIVEEIEHWIAKEKENFLESSSIGKAMKYFLNRVDGFKYFLFYPHIPLSNNGAERAQRDPVMGRKNYLSFRSINGADVAMCFYSIISTCKRLELNAKAYILEMTLRSARKDGPPLETPYQYGLTLRKIAEDALTKDLNMLSQDPG